MNITIPKIFEGTISLPSKREIAKGILLIALARSHISGVYPLGIAFAATFSPGNAYIGLLGLCLGMSFAKLFAIKYILAFFIYSFFIYVKKTEDVKMKMITLGVSVLLSGLISFIWTDFTKSGLLMMIPEVFIAAGAYKLFTYVDEKGDTAQIAKLVLLGGVLNGIGGVVLPYVEMHAAFFAAFFMIMCVCYALEMPFAVLSAAVFGFFMCMDGRQPMEVTGMAVVAAMLSSALAGFGKTGVAVGFLCGITLSVLYNGSLGVLYTADIFVPVCMFIVIPEGVHMRISNFIYKQAEAETEEVSENIRIASRLRSFAKAVCDLADGIRAIPESTRIKSGEVLIGNAVSRVCSGCSLENGCWEREGDKTYKNIYELWQTMEEDGFCDYSNIPDGFRQSCVRSERFIREFNHVYELHKQTVLYKGETVAERGMMARQYGEISRIIDVMSKEIEMGIGEKEEVRQKYTVCITVEQEAKKGSAVCGDTVMHFENDGKYYVILCDGMGTGEAALWESRLTARLFSEFLNAGFKKETAVNMINSALVMNSEQDSFSTADILEIDMTTGAAEFLKVGSAQSFVKTRSGIEEISSKAPPVGILDSIDVSSRQVKLENGDVVLMVSDGIGEAGDGILKNEWIKKLLCLEKRSDSDVVKMIVKNAASRAKFCDDMTCVSVRIMKNKKRDEEASA